MIDTTTMDSLVLEKMKLRATTQASREFVDNIGIHTVSDMSQQLWMSADFRLWGRPVYEESLRSESVPLTPWQHIKEAYFPEWLKGRFPVKTREIKRDVRHYHTCPHLNRCESGSHIEFLTDKDCEARP